MSHAGKERYDNIVIPDDKLLAAIGKGIHKEKRQREKKIIRNLSSMAAAFLLIVYVMANSPILYSYASEIPILKTFVQALRAGGGGKVMNDATVVVDADSSSITISFASKGKITKQVASYEISDHVAPARAEVTFHGMKENMYPVLEEKLLQLDAVKEVYKIKTLDAKDLAFVIVLKRLYNYELMEFADPGSLTIHFFQDAYYTKGERRPEQTVYYLRTEPVRFGSKLKSMLTEYKNEDPTQIRTTEGYYVLSIGEYDSRTEAEKALAKLNGRYGEDTGFYIGSGTAAGVPER